jgi:hypothetical protein
LFGTWRVTIYSLVPSDRSLFYSDLVPADRVPL